MRADRARSGVSPSKNTRHNRAPCPTITAGQTADRAENRPPLVETTDVLYCTPQQKIFAKVKLKVALNSTYTVCDERHINKTGNAVNFLPYIQ
jgi:hypothetical protein